MTYSVFPPTSGGIPGGDSAGRPASPEIGDSYFNGTTAELEVYNGATWVPVQSTYSSLDYVPIAPTIGTATTSSATSDTTVTWTLNSNGGKPLTSITITPYLNGTTAQTSQTASSTSATSHIVTGLTEGSSYTFKVKATNDNGPSRESNATNSVTIPTFITTNFLVVAGGGGAGQNNNSTNLTWKGAGGGAGGYRTSVGTSGGGASAEPALFIPIGANFNVTVGAGGAGGISVEGTPSILSNITSIGGGKGGGRSANSGAVYVDASSGGSGGGGGGGGNSLANALNSRGGGAGTAGQGYAGAAGGNFNGINEAGGGGGAGGVGGLANGSSPGGPGLSSNITGSSVTRAAGGGSSNTNSALPGSGAANLGGGGFGGSNAGDSGVVVFVYPSTYTLNGGSGLTLTTNTSGNNKITTFTAGTGTVGLS